MKLREQLSVISNEVTIILIGINGRSVIPTHTELIDKYGDVIVTDVSININEDMTLELKVDMEVQ